MQQIYPLTEINTRDLWQTIQQRVLQEQQPVSRADNFIGAYEAYLKEHKFVTILAQAAQTDIHKLIVCDLQLINLTSALSVWLKPVENEWNLETVFNLALERPLNYGIAWQQESKAFLIATRDFLEIEVVNFDREAILIQRADALNCAHALFPN
jgi:hypothetical protein